MDDVQANEISELGMIFGTNIVGRKDYSFSMFSMFYKYNRRTIQIS